MWLRWLLEETPMVWRPLGVSRRSHSQQVLSSHRAEEMTETPSLKRWFYQKEDE